MVMEKNLRCRNECFRHLTANLGKNRLPIVLCGAHCANVPRFPKQIRAFEVRLLFAFENTRFFILYWPFRGTCGMGLSRGGDYGFIQVCAEALSRRAGIYLEAFRFSRPGRERDHGFRHGTGSMRQRLMGYAARREIPSDRDTSVSLAMRPMDGCRLALSWNATSRRVSNRHSGVGPERRSGRRLQT